MRIEGRSAKEISALEKEAWGIAKRACGGADKADALTIWDVEDAVLYLGPVTPTAVYSRVSSRDLLPHYDSSSIRTFPAEMSDEQFEFEARRALREGQDYDGWLAGYSESTIARSDRWKREEEAENAS